MRQFRCIYDFYIRCVKLSVTDILLNCACKQMCILQYNSERMTQICFFNLIDINVIVSNLSVSYIIEPVDQVGNRCFSGSC